MYAREGLRDNLVWISYHRSSSSGTCCNKLQSTARSTKGAVSLPLFFAIPLVSSRLMSAGTRIALGARNGASRPALTTRIVASRALEALRWASSSRSSLPLSAAVSAAFSKAPVTPTKSTRTAPTRPAASVEVRGDGLPAYIPLQDPTPFTHPSFFQTTPWPFEQPRIVDGVPYTHYDNDKHVVSPSVHSFASSLRLIISLLQAFGDRILRMLVMDLVIESCPQLSASGTTVRCIQSPRLGARRSQLAHALRTNRAFQRV